MTAGDIGTDMFFIVRGYAQILSNDKSKRVMAIIPPGMYFGEIGMIYGVSRQCTIQAWTCCDVLVLSRDFLDTCSNMLPLLKSQINHVADDPNHLATMQRAIASAQERAAREKAFPARPIHSFDEPLYFRVVSENVINLYVMWYAMSCFKV